MFVSMPCRRHQHFCLDEFPYEESQGANEILHCRSLTGRRPRNGWQRSRSAPTLIAIQRLLFSRSERLSTRLETCLLPASTCEKQYTVQEETSRGYFDDFKELKDSKGKLFSSPDRLIAAQAAPLVPKSQACHCPDQCHIAFSATQLLEGSLHGILYSRASFNLRIAGAFGSTIRDEG